MKNRRFFAALALVGLAAIFAAYALSGDQVDRVGAAGAFAGQDDEAARAELARRGIDFTPNDFIMAAEDGDTTVVRLFVEAGMDIESTDEEQQSALVHAAYEGQAATVALLIALGASPNTTDRFGATPLMYAASEGHPLVVEHLIEAGAELDRMDEAYGMTALMYAAYEGHADIVQTLVSHGAKPNVQSPADGFTALMHGAFQNYSDVVDALLAGGCDADLKDQLGRTASELAKLRGLGKLARQLERAG